MERVIVFVHNNEGYAFQSFCDAERKRRSLLKENLESAKWIHQNGGENIHFIFMVVRRNDGFIVQEKIVITE